MERKPLTKAYSGKELVERLKMRGLDVAEEAATVIVEETFDWLDESAGMSETPYDDILKPIYPVAKKSVMDQVNKIAEPHDS